MSSAGRALEPGESRIFQLPIARRTQETNMWCWAASGEMIMDFLGVNVTQCDEANKRFGRNDCCITPNSDDCAQGGWPEFEKYGFTYDKTSFGPLSWEQIVEQISIRRAPIAFTWAWEGGGGHMMVIYGYSEDGPVRKVLVYDPWPPNVGAERVISYDDYVAAPGYSHWDDYYNVALIPSLPQRSTGPGAMDQLLPEQKAAIDSSREKAAAALKEVRDFNVSRLPGSRHAPITLGQPLTISTVRLDSLMGANPPAPGDLSAPPLSLLKQTPNKVVYSVVNAETGVTGEISVINAESAWRASGIGTPALIRQVAKALPKEMIAADGSLQAPATVVSIPALNQMFVVLHENGVDWYVPTIDDPRAGFVAGKRMTATDALTKLIQAAKAHNKDPR